MPDVVSVIPGMVAMVDPETGLVTYESIAEQRAAFYEKLQTMDLFNRSHEGLVSVEHLDGSVSVDLEGRFQNVTIATVADDGTVTISCVTSAPKMPEATEYDARPIAGDASDAPVTD